MSLPISSRSRMVRTDAGAVNSDAEKEAWTRLVTADERMRRTRSQLRRMAKIAMGYITE